MDILFSCARLAEEIGAPDLKIIDASYHLGDTGRDAAAEFAAGHIPGARFLDLASLRDAEAPFDNTVPGPAAFADRMAKIGVNDGDRIVFYDDSALHSAARAWFLARLYGLDNVAVLDGGLEKWKALGLAEEQGHGSATVGSISTRENTALLRGMADMLVNLASKTEQVVDARSAARFTASEAETRPGMASGHIPGARNVPVALLYNGDGTMKDAADIAAEFTAAGVDLERPVVTSCGSGITAAALGLALARIGKKDVALYDGSWSEWGSDPETPKAKGMA